MEETIHSPNWNKRNVTMPKCDIVERNMTKKYTEIDNTCVSMVCVCIKIGTQPTCSLILQYYIDYVNICYSVWCDFIRPLLKWNNCPREGEREAEMENSKSSNKNRYDCWATDRGSPTTTHNVDSFFVLNINQIKCERREMTDERKNIS